MADQRVYDFIIVGSGPAGCTLAALLAKSAKRPKVLLLEAGGKNDDKSQLVDGQRWITFMKDKMNWGYKTTPQDHCGGRVIDYSRGKGMGGGSAINFGVYTIGARDDYDQWASLVSDDTFSWEKMQTRFKNIENFSGAIGVAENQKFAQSQSTDHGYRGGLRTGYAKEWETDVPIILDSFQKAGLERNLDHNSGNPLGISLAINSSFQGRRSTAVDMLDDVSDNLVIVTDSPVQRVILDGKRAVGVETAGKKYLTSKEVILSAGSLDSPKILMHSGIGEAGELKKFNIPVIQDIPSIGKGLKDHFFVPMLFQRDPKTNERNQFYGDEKAMNTALQQWEKDSSGPWAKYACQVGIGWFKSDKVSSSKEFKDLPKDVQNFLNRPTIPHWEILFGMPAHYLFSELCQDYSNTCVLTMLMNEQSSGTVSLQSSNPNDPLLFDPKFLDHPYDRRACIESLRECVQKTKHSAFAKDTVATLLGPKSDSDEDLLQYWRDNLSSTWHMTGTVKMGKQGDANSAVDNRFRVLGIDNLRVADMSVVPVLANNHVQATSYVTGATCADVLIQEYGLDGSSLITSRL